VTPSLKATEQTIDTPTAAGKCFLDMLGVFGEFETSLRRERPMEGIAPAKANGVYAGKGRPGLDRCRTGARNCHSRSQQHFEGTAARGQRRMRKVSRHFRARFSGDTARYCRTRATVSELLSFMFKMAGVRVLTPE
jgi:DNA invertase Pin-like site-specific DNA recombinase